MAQGNCATEERVSIQRSNATHIEHADRSKRNYEKCCQCQRDSERCDWGTPSKRCTRSDDLDFERGANQRPFFGNIHDTSEPLRSGNCIRLLKLEPKSADSTIRATFVHSCLVHAPKYAILAHRWESEDEVTPLVVNDGTKLVRQSVAQALHSMRELHDQQYFWVDAICINQDDRAEKAAHLKELAKIYHSAEQIFISYQDGQRHTHWRSCSGVTSGKLRTRTNAEFFGWDRKHFLSPQQITSTQTSDKCANLGDMAACQRILCTLFSDCRDDDYPSLSIALSATMMSLRPLTLSELARVVSLLLPTGMSLQTTSELARVLAIQGFYQDVRTHYLRSMIQHPWAEILYVDERDHVCFVEKSMKPFLSRFGIRGIDISHEMMANVCLRELEASNVLVYDEANLIIDGHSLSDFSSYTLDYWEMHFQVAQHTNPALSERLHKILWSQVGAISHEKHEENAFSATICPLGCYNCAKVAYGYCDQSKFTVLAGIYEEMLERGHLQDRSSTFETAFGILNIDSESETDSDISQDSYGSCTVDFRLEKSWATDQTGGGSVSGGTLGIQKALTMT